MLIRVLGAYKKPLLYISALNAATISLIALGLHAEGWSGAEGARAHPPLPVVSQNLQNHCGQSADADREPTAGPVELKSRAAKIFENERIRPQVGAGYLIALSTALKFQLYGRVEHLLNEYECQRTL